MIGRDLNCNINDVSSLKFSNYDSIGIFAIRSFMIFGQCVIRITTNATFATVDFMLMLKLRNMIKLHITTIFWSYDICLKKKYWKSNLNLCSTTKSLIVVVIGRIFISKSPHRSSRRWVNESSMRLYVTQQAQKTEKCNNSFHPQGWIQSNPDLKKSQLFVGIIDKILLLT